MAQPFCSKCGNPVRPDQEYCLACGAAIGEEPGKRALVYPSDAFPASSGVAPPRAPRRSNALFILFGLVVVVLVSLGLVVYAALSPSFNPLETLGLTSSQEATPSPYPTAQPGNVYIPQPIYVPGTSTPTTAPPPPNSTS